MPGGPGGEIGGRSGPGDVVCFGVGIDDAPVFCDGGWGSSDLSFMRSSIEKYTSMNDRHAHEAPFVAE